MIELLVAVMELALDEIFELLAVEKIVFTRCGQIDQSHARLDPVLDVEVGVEVFGWPEVH